MIVKNKDKIYHIDEKLLERIPVIYNIYKDLNITYAEFDFDYFDALIEFLENFKESNINNFVDNPSSQFQEFVNKYEISEKLLLIWDYLDVNFPFKVMCKYMANQISKRPYYDIEKWIKN